jgi:hypothetical protein
MVHVIDSTGAACMCNSDTRTTEAEQRFALIEKRLRDVVTQSLRSDSYSLAAFLQELESVLQQFNTAHSAPVHSELSSEFVKALRAPITVDSKGCLCVALQDSPFHRLLLHAVCQYYGLHSKSVSSSSGTSSNSSGSSDKGKTVRIKPLTKTANKVTDSSSSSGMSLCEFVRCTKVLQRKHDRENRAALATYANSTVPTATTAASSTTSGSHSKSKTATASANAVSDLTRSAARILIRAS